MPGVLMRINGVILGSPTTTTQTWVVTAAGTYTVAVRAVNLWAESPDATLTVNVVVPGRPANVRIQ